jgi:hypothetical protein
VAETIKTGTVLIAQGTLLPASLECEGELFTPGWNWVKNLDSNGIDRIIGQAGWSFFYIAGGVEMIAFGADKKQATGKAIRRIIASLKAKNFNCLEITHVAAKRFLGLPYVSVSAHSRHVQKGRTLFTD